MKSVRRKASRMNTLLSATKICKMGKENQSKLLQTKILVAELLNASKVKIKI